MAASMKLKVAGILTASCIIAIAYLYQPVLSTCSAYDSIIKAASGILVISGSILLSAAIGRTLLKNRGHRAFKSLYLASFSSAGAGVAVSASAFISMNVNAALFALSIVFAVSGVCTLRFFRTGGA